MNIEPKPAVHFIRKISQPVPIPGSTQKYHNEYELKSNCFDPNKFSPPNSWNSRLMIRIGDYDNISCNRITK